MKSTTPVLTPQQLEFIELRAQKGLSVRAAAQKVEIAISTGYDWDKREDIQAEIKAHLAGNRQRIQMRAASLIEKAFDTLSDAMESPAMTPTQVKAAHIVLLMAQGSDSRDANTSPHITVELNTTMNNNIIAEQQSRHRALNAPAIDGEYTIEVS